MGVLPFETLGLPDEQIIDGLENRRGIYTAKPIPGFIAFFCKGTNGRLIVGLVRDNNKPHRSQSVIANGVNIIERLERDTEIEADPLIVLGLIHHWVSKHTSPAEVTDAAA